MFYYSKQYFIFALQMCEGVFGVYNWRYILLLWSQFLGVFCISSDGFLVEDPSGCPEERQ